MNIALITLDSLRYDVAVETDTPNLDDIFLKHDAGYWRKVFTQGTYTLPSHKAMLHQGATPWSPYSQEPLYNRNISCFFRVGEHIEEQRRAIYQTNPKAPNIVKGFHDMGYHTLGIGGVGWFRTDSTASSFWEEDYFEEFYWNMKYHETNNNGFLNQIETMEEVIDKDMNNPLFFFLNVSSTHHPYMGHTRSKEGQGRCLQYIDRHIKRAFDALPKPCHIILTADHGECFGEDGIWGHATYHPKIMEVPMIHFIHE